MQQMAAWTDERLEERFDRIDDRFDEVNRRFDDVGRRFDDTERMTAQRFDEVNRRLGDGEKRTSQRFDEVNRRLDKMGSEIGVLNQGMLGLHSTLNRGALGIVIALIGVIGALLVNG
jgi:tetrahydromethanopterin S-methyltransferase subunit G